MNDKRTPNLGALDEQGAIRLVSDLLTNPDAEEAHRLRPEDYVIEMPQSGERIRGRERMREFQQAYPNPPAMRLRRLIVEDNLAGGSGRDRLAGEAGNDALNARDGVKGNDRANGGVGNDTCSADKNDTKVSC